ncbi:MAG TPA: 4-deoxy-4-formamido-L-arabinose-phosphoundecaprenol deformylase [Gammaproteobacteria bacterium]|nr:4-deoxy-4-formamido-L-arabinose-phosphoundecaprenol deformylase [Gammaproteobacteria bacterium]
MSATPLGLRVDVDTFRGTRDGVPRLLETFAKHGVRATFFFTLGPDNMGRHLKRLLKPRFFMKMLRSRAASLYGWDVLVAGTFWPGKRIGAALGATLRAAENAGHEVGLHAWDHHRWQVSALTMDARALHEEIARGVDAFAEALGRRPDCSAAAGWICNERVLEAKEEFGFRYNSDCRGRSIFVPTVNGRRLAPQVPATLPTYDEVVGRAGVTNENYNERLLARIEPGALNVLTVHAEVEGIVCAALFDEFLRSCAARGVRPVPLRALLDAAAARETDTLALAPIAGRDGDVGWQGSALAPPARRARAASAS